MRAMGAHPTGGQQVRLVGRDAEVAAVSELLERGMTAGGALALVGQPGIGKSALLASARTTATGLHRHALWSVGVEAEAQLPFAGLLQVLAPVLHEVDEIGPTERVALLSAVGMADGPAPDLFLVSRATLALLEVAAGRSPVVVLVDDLQWIDEPSQECLSQVVRRLGGSPVCLIATVRLDASGRRPAVLDAFAKELVIERLDDEAAGNLLEVSAHGLPPAARRRILREAAGNPLALMELPGGWQASAPVDESPVLSARLERDFGGRAATLPEPARNVVLVAAVNEERSRAETLAAAAVLTGRPLVEADLAAVQESGLLVTAGEEIEFRHPLVRSGILQHERMSRRQAAHAAVADVAATPFRRAWHRAQAIVGPDDLVADELEATVPESVRRGAVVTAISSLERSAHLTTSSSRRGHRLLKAAEHAFGLGRGDLVDRLVREAVGEDLDELDLSRVQWLREIFDDGVPGDAVRVLELCDTARRSAAAGDADLALELLLSAALRCWWADSGAASRARVADGVRVLGVDDARAIAALAVAEPVLAAREVTTALISRPADDVADADALRLLGMAAHAIGDSPRSDDYLTAAEDRLRTEQRLGVLVHALSMHVIVLLELGHWDRVSDASAEVLALAEETGQPIWTTGSLVCQAQAEALRGHADRALELASQVELEANRGRLNDLLSCALLARGMAYLTSGRDDEAVEVLLRLFEPDDPGYHQRECFGGLMFLAEAAVRADRRDEARNVLARLETVARVTPAPVLHAQLCYARGVLSPPESADQEFRQARRADLRRWPWVAARLDLAQGSWLRAQGRLEEAEPVLRAAAAVFDRIGARHWAEQANVALDTPVRW